MRNLTIALGSERIAVKPEDVRRLDRLVYNGGESSRSSDVSGTASVRRCRSRRITSSGSDGWWARSAHPGVFTSSAPGWPSL